MPVAWLRARRRKEQPSWKERFGEIAVPIAKDKRRIWIHAVSVGEVVATLPILRELRLLLPQHEIVLSVTTSSGHQTAREQAKDLYDYLVYFPLDLKRPQLAALQRVRPEVVAIMETELWMNFLWAAKVFDAQTMLINGRISDRSFKRSVPLRGFYKTLLKKVDRCLMQTQADADRISKLGGRGVEVMGNTKFDQALMGLEANPEVWRAALHLEPNLPVIVIGSTRGEQEERFVLDALQGLKDVIIVHAPRHVERAPALASSAGKSFESVALRSTDETGRYVILDTYGELDKVYAVADLVIIGGGFAQLGGQNIVQPLAHGKPVLHGPYMQNFRQVAAAADKAGAAVSCRTPEELRAQVDRLLADPLERAKMGHAAKALVLQNTGASKRYADAIAAAARRT
jgi:3-deoxy-D-manno-octulosonic-acid transferase